MDEYLPNVFERVFFSRRRIHRLKSTEERGTYLVVRYRLIQYLIIVGVVIKAHYARCKHKQVIAPCKIPPGT